MLPGQESQHDATKAAYKEMAADKKIVATLTPQSFHLLFYYFAKYNLASNYRVAKIGQMTAKSRKTVFNLA